MQDNRKIKTRLRIKQCASALFKKEGYTETSVNDIATASKISRATFYTHFPGKTWILKDIAADMQKDFDLSYQSFATLPDLSESTIRTWLDEVVLEAFLRSAWAVRILMRHHPSELLSGAAARDVKSASFLLRAVQQAGNFTPEEAKCRAQLLFYQLSWAMHEFVYGRLSIDRQVFVTTLADIWQSALRPALTQKQR